MSGNPEIVPATAEDLRVFYPVRAQTVRAWAARYEGKTVGVFGLSYDGSRRVAFSVYTDIPGRNCALTKMKGARILMEAIGDLPCVAFADKNRMGTAPRFLRHLGFEPDNREENLWLKNCSLPPLT